MNKLLKARQNIRKNSKKGFTLVELIVVIVIIAILIAALAPAIMSVIENARVAADQADARTIMLAGTVFAMNNPNTAVASITTANIQSEITGNNPAVNATVFFDRQVATGCRIEAGSGKARTETVIGDIATAGLTQVTYTGRP